MRSERVRFHRPSWLFLPALLPLAALSLAAFGAEETATKKPAPKRKVAAKEKKAARETDLVAAILRLAALEKKDVVYELGCGKVGAVIQLAKNSGARGVGVDPDASAIEALRAKAKEVGLEKRVTFHARDIPALLKERHPAITAATVVVLSNPQLLDEKLGAAIREELAPETRVASVDFQFKGWKPADRAVVSQGGETHKVFLYLVPRDEKAESLAPFVPTPMEVVEEMLKLAAVTKDDVVYDLGCGDGRIVVEAAKLGARGVGIDFNPTRCDEARERAEKEGVSDRVEIRREDVNKTDFSEATVITLYLLPSSNNRLRPKLLKLKPGTRIVSHDFDIDDWPALKEKTIQTDSISHTLYLWKVGEGPEPK